MFFYLHRYRNLEERRVRISQICAYSLLYFSLKIKYDFPFSYQKSGKILSIEKPPGGRR